MVRFTARPHSGIPIREEEGSVEASTPTAYIPKAEAKPPSSTQNASTTTFELSAEMATALRNQTTTLIHLREKMRLQSSELLQQNVLHRPENGRAPSPHLSLSIYPHPELLHFSTTNSLSVYMASGSIYFKLYVIFGFDTAENEPLKPLYCGKPKYCMLVFWRYFQPPFWIFHKSAPR